MKIGRKERKRERKEERKEGRKKKKRQRQIKNTECQFEFNSECRVTNTSVRARSPSLAMH